MLLRVQKGTLIHDEQKGSGQSSERDFSVVEVDIGPETLIHNHDAFVNSLKSRLTKLQVLSLLLEMIIAVETFARYHASYGSPKGYSLSPLKNINEQDVNQKILL